MVLTKLHTGKEKPHPSTTTLLALCSCEWFVPLSCVLLSCACACDLFISYRGQQTANPASQSDAGLRGCTPLMVMTEGFYAGACERAGDITRVDATWNAARRDDPRRGPTQGTHTERRAPQRTHHRKGGPHRGPTHNTHRQFLPP